MSYPFSSTLFISESERAYLAERGWEVIRSQAERIVRERLAPAFPASDGRQTPMRGHPVFKAQHGAAVCCRGCLAKGHGIPAGRPLTEPQIEYATQMILDWLKDKAGDLSGFPRTPSLFG